MRTCKLVPVFAAQRVACATPWPWCRRCLRVAVPRVFHTLEAKLGVRQPAARPAWYGGLLRGMGAVTAVALVALVATTALRGASWLPGQAIGRNPTAAHVAVARAAAPVDTAAPAAPQPGAVMTVAVEQAVNATDTPAAPADGQLAAAPATADGAAARREDGAGRAYGGACAPALVPQSTVEVGMLGRGRRGCSRRARRLRS